MSDKNERRGILKFLGFKRNSNSKSIDQSQSFSPFRALIQQNKMVGGYSIYDYKDPRFRNFVRKAKVYRSWTLYNKGAFRENLDIDLIRYLSQSVWVQRCITTIQEEVLSQEWDIVNTDPQDKNEYPVAKKIKEFLEYPSATEGLTFKKLIRKVIRDLLEIDAAVILKNFTKNSYMFNGEYIVLKPNVPPGNLVELQVFDSYTFLKDVDEHGALKGYWQYNYSGDKPIPFADREVIFLERNPSSYNLYGWSPVQQIADILKAMIKAVEQTKDFFDKGAIPSGILAADMSQEEYLSFEKWWKNEIEGKPHKLPIMRKAEVQFIPFNETTDELFFLDGLAWFAKVVMSAFHVTPNELGETDAVNKASAEVQSAVFKRKSVFPILKIIEEMFNLEVIPEFDPERKVKFKWKYEPDTEEKSMVNGIFDMRLRNYLQTINEIRQSEGLDPVMWGDVPPGLIEQGIYNIKMLKEKIENPQPNFDLQNMNFDWSDKNEQNKEKRPSEEENTNNGKMGEKEDKRTGQNAEDNGKGDSEKTKKALDTVSGNVLIPVHLDKEKSKTEEDDCVSTKIRILKEEHPDWKQDKLVAVALHMCGKSKMTKAFDITKSNLTVFDWLDFIADQATKLESGEEIALRIDPEVANSPELKRLIRKLKTQLGFEIFQHNDIIVIFAKTFEDLDLQKSEKTKKKEPLTDVRGSEEVFEERAQELDKYASSLQKLTFQSILSYFSSFLDYLSGVDQSIFEGDALTIADNLTQMLNEDDFTVHLQRYIEEAYKFGSDTVVSEVSTTHVEKSIQDNIRYISNFGKMIAQSFISKIRERLRFKLHDLIEREKDYQKIKKQVVEDIRTTIKNTGTLTAQTTIYNALNFGRINKLKQLGYKSWTYYTMQDQRVCKICRPHHLKTYAIDDLRFKPPLHPRCRCFVKGTKEAGVVLWDLEERRIHSPLERGYRPEFEKLTPTIAGIEIKYNDAINNVLSDLYAETGSIRAVARELGYSHTYVRKLFQLCGLNGQEQEK